MRAAQAVPLVRDPGKDEDCPQEMVRVRPDRTLITTTPCTTRNTIISTPPARALTASERDHTKQPARAAIRRWTIIIMHHIPTRDIEAGDPKQVFPPRQRKPASRCSNLHTQDYPESRKVDSTTMLVQYCLRWERTHPGLPDGVLNLERDSNNSLGTARLSDPHVTNIVYHN